MTEFEEMLKSCRQSVERFVKFKISSLQDAEDILQEVYLTAFQKLDTLSDKSQFKAWLIAIARNKCKDHYRKSSGNSDVSLDEISETLAADRYGCIEPHSIFEAISELSETDRRIIYLFYVYGYSQTEISNRLNIPVGTVKSRLFTARKHFKTAYFSDEKTTDDDRKVDDFMKKLPKIMPEYTITKLEKAPFSVKWQELMGWFIVPKTGEKLSWAAYDFPERKQTERVDMEVIGKAEIHGIEGVEITAKQYNPMECNKIDGKATAERTFAAQLTDTHCRLLAETHITNGVKKMYTFLDGEEFMPNWGFGENNCGNEVNITEKGDIIRNGNEITAERKPFLLDVVGRYEVNIGSKTYDTVCVMDIETYNNGVVSEQYLDKNGRTILWRRFNRNDWAFDRYGRKWTEILPDNERIVVNGNVYVHWYDCITDYIFR